jgi:hypothetical protein
MLVEKVVDVEESALFSLRNFVSRSFHRLVTLFRCDIIGSVSKLFRAILAILGSAVVFIIILIGYIYSMVPFQSSPIPWK